MHNITIIIKIPTGHISGFRDDDKSSLGSTFSGSDTGKKYIFLPENPIFSDDIGLETAYFCFERWRCLTAQNAKDRFETYLTYARLYDNNS